MENHFNKVKDYVLDLGYTITSMNEEDGILVIENESFGIKNCVVGCAEPILILEQYITQIENGSAEVYRSLLQKNRDIIHGAFVLDEDGTTLLFRETLQMENLDRNELEGSIDALSLALAEYADELVTFARG
jgi:hypothetical protein